MTSTPTGAGSPRAGSASPEPPLVLRLRGAHDAGTRRTQTVAAAAGRGIRWAEDVVDNEGLGRKSSKVCCIYHKPRAVGESSSEEDSSDSDSDSSGGEGGSDSADDGAARMAGGGGKRGRKGKKGKGKRHEHGHGHGDDCGHAHHGEGEGAKRKRRPSPNAYEKMPNYGKKS